MAEQQARNPNLMSPESMKAVASTRGIDDRDFN